MRRPQIIACCVSHENSRAKRARHEPSCDPVWRHGPHCVTDVVPRPLERESGRALQRQHRYRGLREKVVCPLPRSVALHGSCMFASPGLRMRVKCCNAFCFEFGYFPLAVRNLLSLLGVSGARKAANSCERLREHARTVRIELWRAQKSARHREHRLFVKALAFHKPL
jgi:hypothetical protein